MSEAPFSIGGYDARNIGRGDIPLLARVQDDRTSDSDGFLLSTNIQPAADRAAWFSPSVRRELAGLRVVFLGVVSAGDEAPPGYLLRPPVLTLDQQLSALPPDETLTVVLADLDEADVKAVAKANLPVGLLIVAGAEDRPPTVRGNILVASVKARGFSVGYIRLHLNSAGRIARYESKTLS